MDVGKTARMLGWFSIGLGAAELLMPGALSRTLGVGRHDRLIRGFGLREIGAGLGLLSPNTRKAPWLWARVAGDAVDLGALLAAARRSPKPAAVGTALASVAAVTAVDVLAAREANARKQNWLSRTFS
ncbi:MAG: hypothetical protein DCC71_14075 [Proteobacteria bacterium]|nr:MAG: hypothetical protein DCC71_14075 [Pseudomonadota bacterium]